jgi:hypothetical protein
MDKISTQILQNLQQHLTPILATAGASGLAGGYLTAQTPQRTDETPGQRRMRIIRNALLAGGMGAGAVAGGYTAMNQGGNALPANDVDPVTKSVTSPVARGVYGAGAFGALGKWTHSGTKDTTSAAAEAVQNAVGKNQTVDPEARRFMGQHGIRTALNDTTGSNSFGSTIRGALEHMYQGQGKDPAAVARQQLLASGLPVNPDSPISNVARSALYKTTGISGLGVSDVSNMLYRAPTEGKGMAGRFLPPIARTALAAGAAMYGPQVVGSAIDAGRNYFTGQQS